MAATCLFGTPPRIPRTGHGLDSTYSFVDMLVLPDPYDDPARRPEALVGVRVP